MTGAGCWRSTDPSDSDAERVFERLVTSGIAAGMHPDEVGKIVFDALRQDRFWIYTHPVYTETIQARTDSILAATNPQYAAQMTSETLSDAPAPS